MIARVDRNQQSSNTHVLAIECEVAITKEDESNGHVCGHTESIMI